MRKPKKTLRKRFKYLFIGIVGFVCIIVIGVVIFSYVCLSPVESNVPRENIAVQVKSQIDEFYKLHKTYPVSLTDLPISKNEEFRSYYKERVFRYAKFENGYRFIWIHAGMFTKEGQKHSYSWNATQCSNEKKFLQNVREEMRPDGNGCYMLDLH